MGSLTFGLNVKQGRTPIERESLCRALSVYYLDVMEGSEGSVRVKVLGGDFLLSPHRDPRKIAKVYVRKW